MLELFVVLVLTVGLVLAGLVAYLCIVPIALAIRERQRIETERLLAELALQVRARSAMHQMLSTARRSRDGK